MPQADVSVTWKWQALSPLDPPVLQVLFLGLGSILGTHRAPSTKGFSFLGPELGPSLQLRTHSACSEIKSFHRKDRISSFFWEKNNKGNSSFSLHSPWQASRWGSRFLWLL